MERKSYYLNNSKKAGADHISCFSAYSTVSIESTMLIFPIQYSGTAVAARHAATDTAAASRIAAAGTAVNCSVSVAAALTKIVQIYPHTPPITEAINP